MSASEPPWTERFHRFVEERLRADAEAVEQVCEQALAMGVCGVSVRRTATTTTAWVDPDVPYGEIHERWVDEWPTF